MDRCADRLPIEARDGDPALRALYDRHYSRRVYADARQPALCVGPGSKLVLHTPACDAICIWRLFRSMDRQSGVNCAAFRNEGPHLSSTLIRSAVQIAWERWPHENRLYTYVDPRKVRSTNPGYCFRCAGWRTCGRSKGGLVVLDLYRAGAP